jgi:hypothetical protein
MCLGNLYGVPILPVHCFIRRSSSAKIEAFKVQFSSLMLYPDAKSETGGERNR